MASPTAALAASSSTAQPSAPLLQSTAKQLLLEVKRETEESGRISDDLMSALHFVFQQPLLPALDLVDQGAIDHCSCPSGRELYRVKGSGGRVYTCLTTSNYCSCPSFVYTVLVREDALLCKHMLAVQLARAIAAGRRESGRGKGEGGGGGGGGGGRGDEGRGGEEEEERGRGVDVMDEMCVTDEEFAHLLMSAVCQEDQSHGNLYPQ